MQNTFFQKIGLVLLLVQVGWLHAGMFMASMDGHGQMMAHGVCDMQAAVANGGAVAFIAPMPERTDSRVNGFHASYLWNAGQLHELLSGYERVLAQPPLSIYSKTTNMRLAANCGFSRFAVVTEFVKTGSTVNGVVTPTTLGTRLVVVDDGGSILAEAELGSDKGNVSAQQCHVSFSDDGKLLAACGQYLGLRLYNAPMTDLASFQTLDVGYTTGKAVITSDGRKVFFTRNDTPEECVVCVYDLATESVIETGLKSSRLINDAQLAVSHDGLCMVFRRSSDSLVIASWEGGAWKETVIKGEQIRQPAVSADGMHVVYQVRKASCFQIMSYDRQKEMTTLVSKNLNGDVADADCTSPSISADGLWIAFVSAATNLAARGNGKPQLYVLGRGVPSVTLDLKQGWNLCGMPFVPDDASMTKLMEIGICWGWADGQFKPLGSFMTGQGFWIYSASDQTLRLTGEEAATPPLRQGWNLVLPSFARMEDVKACFGVEDKIYVRLSNPMESVKPVWMFR